MGARPTYPVEYFAVLERHSDFVENGFHWHLLLKGVDFVPHEVLKEAWHSARHGVAYVVHIQAIRKPHVIGYVTKYLTKSLSQRERGVRVVRGVTVESQARRIRYSRGFFPERVAALRARLFSEQEEQGAEESFEDNGKPLEIEGSSEGRSTWALWEREGFNQERGEYWRRRRSALLEALEDVRVGQRRLSRRVIGVWSYQRSERRF